MNNESIREAIVRYKEALPKKLFSGMTAYWLQPDIYIRVTLELSKDRDEAPGRNEVEQFIRSTVNDYIPNCDLIALAFVGRQKDHSVVAFLTDSFLTGTSYEGAVRIIRNILENMDCRAIIFSPTRERVGYVVYDER